jgi:Dolichyl-phosphate-mannose-protein mannosyltransferase
MSGDVVSVLAVLAATNLGLGWYLGFRSLPSYLWFWTLCGLAGIAACRLARSVFAWAGVADAIVRVGIIIFAGVVLAGLTLGSVGLLGTVPYLCLFGAAFAASLTLKKPRDSADVALPTVPIPIAAVLLPLLVCIVAVGLVQSPLTLYDSLSYHLVFPARWLQEHRISIVPTPFSDPAQAYQPGNGELFFLWLMLPFHGDLVARIGQLPFLLLGGAGLYAIARRIGARPEHAAYAPLFYFLARPVVEQAVGADVDLICAATFVTSLYLGIAAVETDARRDWLLWGVSLGLYLGSKYLALVYVPVLLALPLLRGPRLKALWAIPGIVMLALPWYARNWVIAGSPIYPASLKVLGVTVARGAFTRAAMNNSVFHVTSVRLFPAIAAHAFGAACLLFWLPCACIGAVSLLARRRWWPGGYILLIPIVMIPLFWFGIPDNGDSRFLLPALAVAMVPIAFPFGSNARWNACLHAVYLVGAAWIVVGMRSQIPMSLPWFMGDWLRLDGLVAREAVPLFIAGAVVAACLAYFVSRRPAHVAPILAVAFGAGCIAVTVGLQASCPDEECSPLALSPTYVRAAMLVGWQWVHNHVDHSTIANTGNNLPYPLFGAHLSNRVYYVNIDRHAGWRFHDYAHARGRPGTEASATLARASGQLMPLREGRIEEASRPRYERWEGYREAWIQNLRAAGAGYLVVSVLSPYEIDYVWHNEPGFPIEDEWAKADPQIFTLVYENDQIRVYALALQ